jgi:AraC-like DNA-binding protein
MRMSEPSASRFHRLHGRPGVSPNELVVADRDWLHGRFRLPVDWPDFACTGPIYWPTVVFAREPVIIIQDGAEPVVADPNTTIVYNAMRPYRREALTDRGDRCEWFSVAPHVAIEIARSVGLSPASPEALAPFTHAPCDPALYRDQRRLSVLLGDEGSDPLGMGEAVLDVFRRALEPGVSPKQRRSAAVTEPTRRAHRDLAEHAKAVLAQRYAQRLTLDELSDELEVSPFHLARTFRFCTGQTVHRYLTALRIAAALDLIAQGMALTEVAAGTGFSSHSHFTQTFGALLGESPSAWRRKIMRPAEKAGALPAPSPAAPSPAGPGAPMPGRAMTPRTGTYSVCDPSPTP